MAYGSNRYIKGPFRPRPRYHPADPENWRYTPLEAVEAGLDVGPDVRREAESELFIKNLAEGWKFEAPLIIEKAKKALDSIRKGDRSGSVEFDLSIFNLYAMQGRLHYSDIDTSKEELTSLLNL
ncbi:MAG: hypothetical protein Q7R84_01900 [bacterium]|nr:hypothetical protein [bacterium]